MSDEESIVPQIIASSDAEAAKAVAELGNSLIGAGRDAANYLAAILGDAPKNAFGYLLGDRLAAAREMGAVRLQTKVENERLRLGIEHTQPTSPSIAEPMLHAALNETREELQDIWARLIVATTDPSRSSLVKIGFVETLKQFDPPDSLLLKEICSNTNLYKNSELLSITGKLGMGFDDFMISLDKLIDLKCVFKNPGSNYTSTPYGRSLFRAVDG
jgi:hypothetical protein